MRHFLILLQRIERDVQMIRKGIEFTLVEARPGLWKWSFRIGETVRTGRTETNLMGMAAHRVQQRIDRELREPRSLGSAGNSPQATSTSFAPR